MDAHLANARRGGRPGWTPTPGWPTSTTPGCRRTRTTSGRSSYLPLGAGSVFAFGVAAPDGRDARAVGERFIESLQLASHLANVGDAKTLVLHPGSTTHRQLSAEQLDAAGVRGDLIRLSVGLEDVEDILWDLDQALTRATGRTREGARGGRRRRLGRRGRPGGGRIHPGGRRLHHRGRSRA